MLQREEVKIGLGRLGCTATLLGPPRIENPTHRRGPSSNQVGEKPEGVSCHEQTPETKQTIFQKVLHECKRRGMPDGLTSQATHLSDPVISAGKMTYGFLPTCVTLINCDQKAAGVITSVNQKQRVLALPFWPARLLGLQGTGAGGTAAGVLSISETLALGVYHHGASAEVLLC